MRLAAVNGKLLVIVVVTTLLMLEQTCNGYGGGGGGGLMPLQMQMPMGAMPMQMPMVNPMQMQMQKTMQKTMAGGPVRPRFNLAEEPEDLNADNGGEDDEDDEEEEQIVDKKISRVPSAAASNKQAHIKSKQQQQQQHAKQQQQQQQSQAEDIGRLLSCPASMIGEAVSAGKGGCKTRDRECLSNDDCSTPSEVCCRTRCGTRCVSKKAYIKPKPQQQQQQPGKLYECPKLNSTGTAPEKCETKSFECVSEEDCSKEEKCCRHDCGRKCVGLRLIEDIEKKKSKLRMISELLELAESEDDDSDIFDDQNNTAESLFDEAEQKSKLNKKKKSKQQQQQQQQKALSSSRSSSETGTGRKSQHKSTGSGNKNRQSSASSAMRSREPLYYNNVDYYDYYDNMYGMAQQQSNPYGMSMLSKQMPMQMLMPQSYHMRG